MSVLCILIDIKFFYYRLVPLVLVIPALGNIVRISSTLSAVSELDFQVIGMHRLILLKNDLEHSALPYHTIPPFSNIELANAVFHNACVL